MIMLLVIWASPPSGMRSLRTISARARSTCWRLRLANAVTRMRAPSSSRMLVWIRVAMNSSTSGPATRRSWAAFLRRMAIRVSRSGAWTSVMRPQPNRLRSRGSRFSSSFGGRSRGHDDLLLGVVQRVEGVEELLLRLLLALQELDVVDQQHVDVAVALPELDALVLADRVDEVVRQLLGGDVAHARRLEVAADVVAERVQQVGLAQPGVAVDGQRVVRLARVLRDGDGRGVGEAVRRADDEGLEGVLRVEPGADVLARAEAVGRSAGGGASGRGAAAGRGDAVALRLAARHRSAGASARSARTERARCAGSSVHRRGWRGRRRRPRRRRARSRTSRSPGGRRSRDASWSSSIDDGEGFRPSSTVTMIFIGRP